MVIDTILEDSFPASDPPSWTPGASAGDPSCQEQVMAPTGHPWWERVATLSGTYTMSPGTPAHTNQSQQYQFSQLSAKQGESNGYVNVRITT